MHEVIMPKLGITMESGRIEKWHKKEGDKVKAGEVLFEVMTDKVTIEVESYNSGILKKILKGEGQEVPVTEVVAYIGGENEKIPVDKSEKKGPDKNSGSGTEETGKKAEQIKKDPVTSQKRIKISPLARKIAQEMGIDYRMEKIKGSGPGGRIEKKDVIDYSKKKADSGKEEEKLSRSAIAVRSSSELSGMRKLIAQRMSYSSSNIPHIVLNVKVDTTRLAGFKDELKEKLFKKYGVEITYTDLILKSAASALRNNLELNSTFSNGRYIIYDDINIGLAVSLGEGLIVPTIFNCDRLAILDIAKRRIDLVNKAAEGKLSLGDVSNGTFTVTNLGMYGIRSFTAIINPPQAAILAVGEIYTEAGVVRGEIKPLSFLDLSASCDHRIIDGKTGAKFMQEIRELLENPSKLID